jgi:hypothetical protein
MTDRIKVGNTEIGPTTDFAGLLRRQLTGGTALSGRYDETPEQGVLNLFAAVQETPLAPLAAAATTQLLTDPDLDVRAGAVAAVEEFPKYFDSSLLLNILRSHPRLYEGVGSNHFGRKQADLAWALLRGMAAVPSRDTAVRDRLRLAAQDRANGSWVLAGVTANDRDWVIAHPSEVIQADPTRAWIVVLNLGDADSRERFVRAVPRESPDLRDAVTAGIQRAVQNEAERNRLLNMIRG